MLDHIGTVFPGPAGSVGLKGDIGAQGPKGDQGIKGDKGDIGPTGLTGIKGQKGQNGVIIDNQLPSSGGTVYVRWGHDRCPISAERVYTGRVGGSFYLHKGGGSDPQCLPQDPIYLQSINGSQRAYMYGAEYETIVDIKNVDDLDVPCAVCYVSQRSSVYMVPAKYICPSGWTREYYGYLMASYYDFYRTQYTCVDSELKAIAGSTLNLDGFLFYPVEGKCGSLPCPPYNNNRELSCAVCTR